MAEQQTGVVTPQILRVPGWDQFSWLRAAFSTRQGGVSTAYGQGERNLGWTQEDSSQAVAENRRQFVAEVASGSKFDLVTVQQIHGREVRDLEEEPAPWMTKEGKSRLKGDGLITLHGGRLLGILTADCVPVLIADTRRRAVGAFHAGWRGTLARIVEHGVDLMGRHYGSRADDLIAAIGPCVGRCCYRVGVEVGESFAASFDYAGALFSRTAEQVGSHQAVFLDLVEANRRQLQAVGLKDERIFRFEECTACTRLRGGERKYFSFRDEQGVTGRMLSVIGTVTDLA